jgi:hypothetical protein
VEVRAKPLKTGLLFAALVAAGFALERRGSAEPAPAPSWYESTEVTDFRDDLSKLDGVTAAGDDASASCKSAYDRVFARPTVEVSVFFGYTNDEADPGAPATDLVYDPFVKESFSRLLQQPCSGSLAACDFRPEGNADTLVRELPGPDGRPRTVRIHLEASSVTESDRQNRHPLGSRQKSHSRGIERDFLASLDGSQVVIYAGHARHGTGPGFKPLPSGSLSWIEAGIFHPSWRRMRTALKRAKSPPALIGMFACLTDHFYRKGLMKAAPRSGLVLTEVSMQVEEAHESLLGTLNAVLGLRCEADFGKSLRNTRLFGFF